MPLDQAAGEEVTCIPTFCRTTTLTTTEAALNGILKPLTAASNATEISQNTMPTPANEPRPINLHYDDVNCLVEVSAQIGLQWA